MRTVAVVVACAVGEGLVLLVWLTAGRSSAVVLVQVLVVAVLVVVAFGARYAALRARYLDQVAAHAAAMERSRLAEDMHDTLGHELSLLAVQAGALQLAHPDTADRSAAIRDGAERATLVLREIVSVLPATHLTGTLDQTAASLDAILSRARAAGLAVVSRVDGLEELPRVVHDTLERLVREALTNAGRHAPGAPVTVGISRCAGRIRVEIANDATEALSGLGTAVGGNGLAALRRRVGLLGGTMSAGISGGIFTLHATVPCQPVLATSLPPVRVPVRPTRVLVTTVLVPAAAVLLALLGYHTWAVHDATTDPVTMTRIHPGMAEATARELLPRREAPVRLSAPPRPAGADSCRYYTDGNFPVGYASWRVCFGSGTVLTISDLR
jgi:hypothetical protein